MESGLYVAGSSKLFPDATALDPILIVHGMKAYGKLKHLENTPSIFSPLLALGFRIFVLNSLEDGLRCQHPAPHGVVSPLDLGHVHESGSAANEAAAGE